MLLAYTPDTYLLATQWKQGEPYNKFLPEIDDQNVVAGCVNVAVAQVMKYHGYPSAGKGVARYDWNGRQLKVVLYRTYNWKNMPDLLNAGQPEYKVDEIALLIKDLAIVHHTSFGSDGSTASINTSTLVENFGYSNTITSMNNSDVTLFFETLRSEINAERPVLLSFPGHMVVADGYSSNETGKEIHVNMGWGGHHDDYYFLDQTVYAGDHTFEPDLTIYYNIKPCSGADCFVNLESEDSIDGVNITGKFDYDTDTDRYDLYLKGDTAISGDRGFSNQAFYISIYDSDNVIVASGNEPMTVNLSANKYTVKISLQNESGSYSYDDKTDYVVTISTDTLTEAEKTAINSNLDIAPVINSSLNDILLNSSNPTALKILIDARDENGDVLNLNISNTNHSALQAVLIGNILELTPVDGASGIAGKVTVIASANNKSIEKSFVAMVSDEDISFGKEFVVTGVFENQDDFNTHKVILDGACSITGYNGYSNQAFYTSVMGTSENVIVPPIDNKINHDCESGIYLLGASLEENPGEFGNYYPYDQDVNDQYRLTVRCPDADDSVENIANILGIDLSGTLGPLYFLTVFGVGTGSGTVISSSPGIDCGFDCSEAYNHNMQVTLIAKPDPGSAFTGWSGTECSGTGDCTVTMDTEKNVAAIFALILIGDLDLNGIVELSDTLSALQVYTGINTASTIHKESDANSDGKIGLQEVIYILQKVSGLR